MFAAVPVEVAPGISRVVAGLRAYFGASLLSRASSVNHPGSGFLRIVFSWGCSKPKQALGGGEGVSEYPVGDAADKDPPARPLQQVTE